MNDEVQRHTPPVDSAPISSATGTQIPITRPSRRSVLRGGLAAVALGSTATAVTGQSAAAAQTPPASQATPETRATRTAHCGLGTLAVRGGDISFLLQEEAIGKTFTDHGRVRPVERILAEYGASWVRLRIWVNPPAGYSTLETALVLAKRAKLAGLKILIDPHYADFWADPSKQPIPTGWPNATLADLAAKVRSYTRHIVRAFADQGTPADMIQIGNEVTSGMLWPWGKIYQPDGAHWAEFATLVQAGLDGAAEGNPHGHRLRTMLHIDRGGDNGGTRWFFDHIFAQGIDVDVIGQSYYSVWHGSLADLSANLNDTATAYGKDIVVAEVQYPWTTANGDSLDNFVWKADQLPDGVAYPPTVDGQLGFFNALRDVIAAVPNHHGAGFLAWEPEWIPGIGWEPGAGTPNDNMTMFDFNGAALPSLRALRRPVG